MWGFPKIRGTLLGALIIRIIIYWGLYWGPLIWGNYHAFSLGFWVLSSEFTAMDSVQGCPAY